MNKIVVSILAYNAEPFIKPCLDSIYDFADLIVIVEGSFERQRIFGLRSPDATTASIMRYPDKRNKIRFFQMNKHEHDHRNIALCFCDPGDWYFTVDADEIYKEKDLRALSVILKKDRSTDMFRLFWYNFYFNFRLYLKEVSPPRIFRVRKGCRFVRRNTMVTAEGIPYEKLKARTIPQSSVLIYHYGYISNVRMKMALYGKAGRQWYDGIFMKFDWKNRNRIYKLNALRTKEAPGIHFHGGGKLMTFRGEHPSAIMKSPLAKKDLISAFKKGYVEPRYANKNILGPLLYLFRTILYGWLLR